MPGASVIRRCSRNWGSGLHIFLLPIICNTSTSPAMRSPTPSTPRWIGAGTRSGKRKRLADSVLLQAKITEAMNAAAGYAGLSPMSSSLAVICASPRRMQNSIEWIRRSASRLPGNFAVINTWDQLRELNGRIRIEIDDDALVYLRERAVI